MLFQPTNVLPSDQYGGAGTVDVTKDIPVSWQINGPSGMVAYQIDVMQNDTASTQVYTTGKVELDAPFYGVDYNGDVQYFSATLPSPAGMTNGYANGYKMVITQWWSASESVAQTSAACFITRAEPTLSIDSLPATISTRTGEFTAAYTQAQGDALNWFRWQIAESDDVENPLKDTGYIYGTEDIRVTYDGFFPGTEYAIRCQAQTQNGVNADTGWKLFSCAYSTVEQRGLVTACQAVDTNAVSVNWSEATYILGTANGNYSIENSELVLPEGSSVTWDSVSGAPMSFAAQWSIVWNGKPSAFPVTAWEITGEGGQTMSLRLSQTQLAIYRNGQMIFSFRPSVSFAPDYSIAVALTPQHVYIRHTYGQNGLYPSQTLYPSGTLYPLNEETFASQYDAEVLYNQFDIHSVALNGPQTCSYIWVVKGTLAQDIVSDILYTGGFAPDYDENTYMLANFENGLNAGSLPVEADDVTGFSIYRREGEQNTLLHLADVPLTITAIYDYAAKSQTSYTYYIFAVSPTVYVTQPLVSGAITTLFWDWVILECSENAGRYDLIAEHKFSNNVSTSAISNNSTPNLLTNFTRFPKRQPVSANYKSGTLQGYIGTVDFVKNTYTDTPVQADALFNLSTNTNPKFLKNRKGDIWMIETAAPVTMTVGDNSPLQPYTGAISWVEVGPAENLTVILEN